MIEDAERTTWWVGSGLSDSLLLKGQSARAYLCELLPCRQQLLEDSARYQSPRAVHPIPSIVCRGVFSSFFWGSSPEEPSTRILFYFLLFSIPFAILSSPFFSLLPPSRNSDPGSHSRLFSHPSPLRFVPCIFIARRIQHFLPSSTRVEVCLPTVQWARPTVAVI